MRRRFNEGPDGLQYEPMPIRGAEVIQVRVDYAFSLIVEVDDEYATSGVIRINAPLVFDNGSGPVTIDPERAAEVAPLLTLHKAVIASAEAAPDGRLSLRFLDRRTIDVESTDEFEAWEAHFARLPDGPPYGLVAALGRQLVKTSSHVARPS